MSTDEYFTMKDVMKKTGIKTKKTLVRLEETGVIDPPPKRRVRDDARLYTQQHIDQITGYWTGMKEPSEQPQKRRQRGKG